MFRWFRLFGRQYMGFWIVGLLLFILQEVPYMVMPLFRLTDNPVMNMQEASPALGVLEKLLGFSCVAALCLIVQEKAVVFDVGRGICRIGFVLAVILLLGNFTGWGLYYSGHQTARVILAFIVALPPLYYAAIGLWRENWILLLLGIAFEAVHFVHVYGSLKL